jgi:homeobox protein ESX1
MLHAAHMSPSVGGLCGQSGAAHGGQMPALQTPPLHVWLHEQHVLSEHDAPSVVHMPPLTHGVVPPVPPPPASPALPEMPPVPPRPELPAVPPAPPSAPVPPIAPVPPVPPVATEPPSEMLPPVEVLPPVVIPPLPPSAPPTAPAPPWPELPPVVPLPPDSDLPAIPPVSSCETLVPPQAAAKTRIDAVNAAPEARRLEIMEVECSNRRAASFRATSLLDEPFAFRGQRESQQDPEALASGTRTHIERKRHAQA